MSTSWVCYRHFIYKLPHLTCVRFKSLSPATLYLVKQVRHRGIMLHAQEHQGGR